MEITLKKIYIYRIYVQYVMYKKTLKPQLRSLPKRCEPQIQSFLRTMTFPHKMVDILRKKYCVLKGQLQLAYIYIYPSKFRKTGEGPLNHVNS
jgi:hypothetical protein